MSTEGITHVITLKLWLPKLDSPYLMLTASYGVYHVTTTNLTLTGVLQGICCNYFEEKLPRNTNSSLHFTKNIQLGYRSHPSGMSTNWAVFQHQIKSIIVRSHKISQKLWYSSLELSDCSQIWQASEQHCHWGAHRISKWNDNLISHKIFSLGILKQALGLNTLLTICFKMFTMKHFI